ncbi:MAG: Hsp20/alpha crystallin family protein [Methanomicrobiaceae archaeon]|uniref:Small heat shock protein n=1 Tax=hydrocarbon metagenome TaxID=938273 RepID=A0A0W8FGT4_9ZZZZ|nr:Hsp20/alpha crystallin family protein [Methanomicrobiaceae archaeon]
MSENPTDIFQQLNELMKRLMEQTMKDQGKDRPFAYGFKIIISDADTLKSPASPATATPQDSPSQGSIEPIAEVYMEDDNVTVAVDLPGVEKDRIHLSLIGDTLTIVTEGNQLTSVDLPPVDGDSMKSTYKHGVLEVRFARGKPIRID